METFDLGRVIATAEGIKQMRRQSTLDTLREQALQGQITQGEQSSRIAGAQEQRAATQFSQEQQITGTKLLNAAAAEIAQDPSDEVLQRWLPQLDQAGIKFGANPMAAPPEVRQQFATKLYHSTSAALASLNPLKPGQAEDVVQTVGPDGKPVFTKKSQAPGMTPYVKPDSGESTRPQLSIITRPAEGKDGLVQDYTFDAHTGKKAPVGEPYSKADAAGSSPLGSRESVFFQRVVNSANSAATALQNIAELPVGASSGMLGVGSSPGHSIFGSVQSALKNKLASQDVQDYNTMLAGVSRNLSTIETAGLAPNGSITQSMDSIQLREGDTELTKIRKLAEMRQIIEKGIEPNLSNPRLPDEQKQLVRDIVNQVKGAIPYTQHDVTELQRKQQKNPDFTLQDLIKSKGLGPKEDNASPVKVNTPEEAMKLPSGTQFVTPDGRTKVRP